MSEATSPAELPEDHYAEHLAEVNENQEVLSSEDIVNDNGVLLCKKGMRINRNTAERLIHHKLSKPLEESVQLSQSLSNPKLFTRLLGQLEKYPDLQQISEQLQFNKESKDIFLMTRMNPLITQKLTVISDRLPEQLDKAVVTAWLAYCLAREMGKNKEFQQAAFLAGMLHDIGFIHISPSILHKQEALNAEEWRAIQSHVVIGKIVLQKIRDIPAITSRAVLEHHERCDGSGYPTGKAEESLSVLGQIIGLTDSIYSIRINQLEKRGRNLYDLAPYLQMNAHTHFYDVYKAAHAILKKSGLKSTIDPGLDIPETVKSLVKRGQALRETVGVMEENNILDLLESIASPKGQALHKITRLVLKMTNQSGLLREELYTWLTGLDNKPDMKALQELHDMDLMLNELQWQLNSACRACNAYFDEIQAPSASDKVLQDIAKKMTQCLDQLRN